VEKLGNLTVFEEVNRRLQEFVQQYLFCLEKLSKHCLVRISSNDGEETVLIGNTSSGMGGCMVLSLISEKLSFLILRKQLVFFYLIQFFLALLNFTPLPLKL